MRYMVWNNKGGVGKTFLTYAIATEYAIAHPEKSVAVVDMCPQANVSEMLLGGNGTGEANLAGLAKVDQTISGYIKARYAKSSTRLLGTENGYFIPVSKYNLALPQNLFLLPGDVDLDICSQLITHMGNAPVRGAWASSRRVLDDIVGAFENAHDNAVVFIDTNPSFAVYTEMSAVCARELIIPCTADNASIRGILNVFRLVFGINAYQIFGVSAGFEDSIFTFADRAAENGVQLPKIRMIILNKSRSLDSNATKAWQAHSAKIHDVMQQVRNAYPNAFASSAGFVFDVKDGNTLATIVNHTGLPISNMKHGAYDVYGVQTMANGSQIVALLDQLRIVVGAL